MKTCTKCGCEYPATKEFFYAQKTVKDGLRARCKKCTNEEVVSWGKNNPEKIKAWNKRYRESHLSEAKRYGSVYRIEKAEEIKDCKRKYMASNPSKAKIWISRYYQKNKASCIEKSTAWKLSNPEKNTYTETKRKLKKQIGETPPPELVEVKVLINKTKKLCKTLKN